MPGRLHNKVRPKVLHSNRGPTNFERTVCSHHRCWIVITSLHRTSIHDLSGIITLFLCPPNSGIGMETSLLFASEGANVLLVDINLKAVEAVAALITARYPNVKNIATKTDVGVEKEIKGAIDLAVKEFGRLDIVVRLSPIGMAPIGLPPSSLR